MSKKRKIKRTEFIKWGCFFLLIGLFFLLGRRILKEETLVWDEKIFSYLRSFESETMTTIFKAITNLASVVALISITLLIWIIPKFRIYGKIVTGNLLLSSLSNPIIKLFYARNRPLNVALIEESGYSFPSGHSMISMSFYGLFIYLLWHSQLTKPYKIISILGLTLLILFIGISRIYLGVHFASDVIGGFFLALGYLILFTHFAIVRKKKRGIDDAQKEI